MLLILIAPEICFHPSPPDKRRLNFQLTKYRVIWKDCQGFNNLSYTIHLR